MVEQLSYRGPAILRAVFDLLRPDAAPPLRILDLGCGTGLAGEAFRDLSVCGRLDGIDLSPRMLDAARRRGIYDSLVEGELRAEMERPGPDYDLVIAADCFVYLGDLAPVFDAAFGRLTPGGFLLFTVERGEGDAFARDLKRRYRHGEAYLRKEAERAGFEIMGLVDCVPRREAGRDVEGLAVALAKNGR
jgi:predicted TPR repeat methyltransferase